MTGCTIFNYVSFQISDFCKRYERCPLEQQKPPKKKFDANYDQDVMRPQRAIGGKGILPRIPIGPHTRLKQGKYFTIHIAFTAACDQVSKAKSMQIFDEIFENVIAKYTKMP